LELDTVSYVFQSRNRTFTIKPRVSGRWRVSVDSMPWGDSFSSAQEAAIALSREFPVPAALQAWTEVGHYHTADGRWAGTR